MKPKLLLPFAFVLLLFNGLSAQIILDIDDAPKIGDILLEGNDTLAAGITEGTGGANQVWDFSTLVNHGTIAQSILDPTTTLGANDFPQATVAIEVGEVFTYVQLIDNMLELLGISADLFGTGDTISIPFDPTQTIFVFPTTYGTMYQDTHAFEFTLPFDLIPGIDSIRNKQTVIRDVEIDGYGKTILPEGTYNSLRQKEMTIQIDSFWGHSTVFDIWIFGDAVDTMFVDFSWLARESKGVLVDLDFDTTGNVSTAAYTLTQPLPYTAFTYDEISNGTYQFTDQSLNNPVSWAWNFGDGGMSTEQNPEYTYAAPGDYEVCLTVTNSVGSNTVCKTLSVVLIPIANFDYMDDLQGNLTFTDLSQNNPDSWSWDFGDGNMSTEQNPTHTYTQSGTYTICLIASNSAGADTLCQNVDVFISSTLETEGLIHLSIFPNPAKDFLRIEFENLYGNEFDLVISDALGRRIIEFPLKNNLEIDVRNWMAGIYNYQILNSNGVMLKSDKIMIIVK